MIKKEVVAGRPKRVSKIGAKVPPVKTIPLKNKTSQIDFKAISRKVNGSIKKQRRPLEKLKFSQKNVIPKNSVKIGIEGLDKMLLGGIPKGSAVLISGGAGSGKTIMCLQSLIYHASKGKKCLIMTLEESEERLIEHMEGFGWPAKKLIKKGNLRIVRADPFDIMRNVDAMMAKQKGELLIDINPIILPKDFQNPDFLAIDSLTAIASAFTRKDESYRMYISQLFKFLERCKATSLLIAETAQVPKIFSPTGVEEFLADGVIILYNIKHENVRENAVEVLKLRGANHEKKIIAMQITGKGIVVYPDQEVFSEIK